MIIQDVAVIYDPTSFHIQIYINATHCLARPSIPMDCELMYE